MGLAAFRTDGVDEIDVRIRQILQDHGRLGTDVETLFNTVDLLSAGLTSHAHVNVVLALESGFDIEFPDGDAAGGAARVVDEVVLTHRASVPGIRARLAGGFGASAAVARGVVDLRARMGRHADGLLK